MLNLDQLKVIVTSGNNVYSKMKESLTWIDRGAHASFQALYLARHIILACTGFHLRWLI